MSVAERVCILAEEMARSRFNGDGEWERVVAELYDYDNMVVIGVYNDCYKNKTLKGSFIRVIIRHNGDERDMILPISVALDRIHHRLNKKYGSQQVIENKPHDFWPVIT